MENNQTPESNEEDYKGILGDFQESAEPENTPSPESTSEPTPKKENNALKIAGVAVASAAILGCLGFLGVKLWNTSRAEMPATSQAENSAEAGQETTVNPAELLPENTTAAMYSEHGEISPELMECFYQNCLSQYASAMSYYGIDEETDLKTTKLPEEAGEDVTWFEYLMNQVKSSASQLLVFQEAANNAGYEMTDEDKQKVEEQLSSVDLTSYGENATEENVRTILEMQTLASSYFNYVLDNMVISDEELQSYYEANKKNFDTCSLMGFNVFYQTEDETTDTASDAESETEAETKMPQETAKAFADKLLAVKSPEEFETIVKDVLINYENYEESELTNLSSQIRSDNFSYQEGFEAAEWAFGGTAKAGETHLVENDGVYSVYYLLSEPALDTTATVNVRHILFATDNHIDTADDDNTDDTDTADETASETETETELSEEESKAQEEAALKECHRLAENTLKEWEKGDKSEDSFAELANQYSEDPGSNTNGGLYEKVTPGQMVQTFNDWCFDTSRKAGDTGIVETNYGVHVMYFSGTGEPLWKDTAKSEIQTENIDKWFEEQRATYPVAENEEIINAIA